MAKPPKMTPAEKGAATRKLAGLASPVKTSPGARKAALVQPKRGGKK